MMAQEKGNCIVGIIRLIVITILKVAPGLSRLTDKAWRALTLVPLRFVSNTLATVQTWFRAVVLLATTGRSLAVVTAETNVAITHGLISTACRFVGVTLAMAKVNVAGAFLAGVHCLTMGTNESTSASEIDVIWSPGLVFTS